MINPTIIFDLFGTLVEIFPMAVYKSAVDEMSKELGISPIEFSQEFSGSYHQRILGDFESVEDNILGVLKKLSFVSNRQSISKAADIYTKMLERSIKPRYKCFETLKELKSRGHQIGLISDAAFPVPRIFNDLGFKKYIEKPIFSCEVKIKKPDQKIFNLTCERLNSNPTDCLYVGDGGSKELSGARKIGMKPVLIKLPFEDPDPDHRPDAKGWQGQSINELPELLEIV